ncbi:HNH endonuclease [Tardiphaga sp. 538_B7_N1_4]|uniref:HNH endonuclease n=1 Tax=Tardiphaga sp. 538_B7_N1_4 TaxID=3240778 RepID=UPI003F267032
MSRAVDTEWVAKNDDQAIPPRVKLRIFAAAGGRCEECTNLIVGKLRPEYDHRVALINGGAHAEHNLQLLCSECHKVKTRADVAEKSTMARKRTKAAGIKKKRTITQWKNFRGEIVTAPRER